MEICQTNEINPSIFVVRSKIQGAVDIYSMEADLGAFTSEGNPQFFSSSMGAHESLLYIPEIYGCVAKISLQKVKISQDKREVAIYVQWLNVQ